MDLHGPHWLHQRCFDLQNNVVKSANPATMCIWPLYAWAAMNASIRALYAALGVGVAMSSLGEERGEGVRVNNSSSVRCITVMSEI
jgi:hypothetical protein